MQINQTINLFTLRVAAIQGFLIYINDKRCTYADLLTVPGVKFYKLIKQDLREIKVSTDCPDSIPNITIVPDKKPDHSYKAYQRYRKKHKHF